MHGSKKTWIPTCPWDKYLLKFACPWQVLLCPFNDLVGGWLAWSFAHWARENVKLLAQKENLLVQGNGMALFSSLVHHVYFIQSRYYMCRSEHQEPHRMNLWKIHITQSQQFTNIYDGKNNLKLSWTTTNNRAFGWFETYNSNVLFCYFTYLVV